MGAPILELLLKFASAGDAFVAGQPILELCPRYNRIDESNYPERTEGVTYRAIVGWRTAPWQGLLRYDYEVKGSNNGLYGLQMPLTDFYAFNGWSLHFFNTPRFGLRDRWVTGRFQVGPLVFYAEEHRFRSDFSDLDYGRETDLGLTWLAHEKLTVRLQNARYRPGTTQPTAPAQPRITKTWLTATYIF